MLAAVGAEALPDSHLLSQVTPVLLQQLQLISSLPLRNISNRMHEPPHESSAYKRAAALPQTPWVSFVFILMFDETLTVLGAIITSADTTGSSWGFLDWLKSLFEENKCDISNFGAASSSHVASNVAFIVD